MNSIRMERYKKFITYVKKNGSTVNIFSDEIFTMDTVVNPRNQLTSEQNIKIIAFNIAASNE